ncbi:MULTISPECIES: YjjG family noncanonical pyrimidine nucleotidase [unclassified Sporolactobacillus]|uniref:YjjG family noncanonical pyrimidine nucleotidase n=1 Tax=unclassified Sporolactobacillus TaxID=2628533 RepID=UPI002367E925|nr:YjjG family noncanonical pyrimidine nucleotidase [Sporolactobacillus sp. CQH2019]MDD9148704.1 YjjG family noncanonical pyrimidine nucleotidase [Sporolactobacillus sp. CQH2019]
MKKYRTLFFDVDDTLLDFRAAENQALKKFFREQKIPFTSQVQADYQKLNRNLWKAYEEGKIDRDEVVNTRFSRLLSTYGQKVDGTLMEKNYRRCLEEGHQRIPGALELISHLRNRYDLYIVTNGVSKTQNKRLRDSGLLPLFKKIFSSEAAGFQKPMRQYFDYVFARIPGFSADQGLMIGDSISSDIKGGQLAGLDTCWFNPEMKSNLTAFVPTYQIQQLDELDRIL